VTSLILTSFIVYLFCSCNKLDKKGTVMQIATSCLYQRQIRGVDELERQLIDVWCGFEQWGGRHSACVRAKGGACEQALLILSVSVT